MAVDPWQAASIFKALANEHRIQIVQRLAEKDLACRSEDRCDLSESCCDVSDLAASLDISLPTVSYHLKELRTVGLITTQRQGRHIYCSLNAALLAEAIACVWSIGQADGAPQASPFAHVQGEGNSRDARLPEEQQIT